MEIDGFILAIIVNEVITADNNTPAK